MSLGVHFALDPATEARLLAAADQHDADAMLALIDEIEDGGQDRLTCHHQKAWDALHRCLTDGSLNDAGASYPLGATVLGGRQLMPGNQHFTISYVAPDQVGDVSRALDGVEEDWFRQRYFALADTNYYGPIDADDLNETWADFTDTREFFDKAARSGLSVIFTVDA